MFRLEASRKIFLQSYTRRRKQYAGAAKDTDDDEEVAPNEPSSYGHVVNVYQCSQTMSKTNTKKQPQKQIDRYKLRSKGAPPTLGEIQENMRLLMRKANPPAAPKQKTQNKFGNTTVDKSTSMNNKLQNTPPDNMNIRSTPNTSVGLPPLDYNIFDDMKKTQANISLFELAKILSQRDIRLRALRQTTIDSATSTSKGASTPPKSLSTVLNTLRMEEANSGCPPFLLSFEISNCNVYNCFIDSSTITNIMSLFIAKKINAQWSETSCESSNLLTPLVNYET